MEALRSTELLGPAPTGVPSAVRSAPAPLHGGPLALLRFMRRNGMLNFRYARLIVRLLRKRCCIGRRLKLDGLAFIGPGVMLQVGKGASVELAAGRGSGTARSCAATRASSRSAPRP